MELEPSAIESVKELLKKGGVTLPDVVQQIASTQPTHRVGTRAAKVDQWTHPKKAPSSEEDAVLQSLPQVLGTTVVPKSPRKLTKKETDTLAKELRTVREVQDILSGRHEWIRGFVFDTLDFQFAEDGVENPKDQPGALIADGEGYVMRRGINGGKPFLDEEKLKANVSEDLWERITEIQMSFKVTVSPMEAKTLSNEELTTLGEWTEKELVNEEAVVQAVNDGYISLETLADCIDYTNRTQTFNPAPVK